MSVGAPTKMEFQENCFSRHLNVWFCVHLKPASKLELLRPG